VIDKLLRICRVTKLILKERDVYQFVRTMLRHISNINELSAEQFFTGIITCSRDLAAWQRDIYGRARRKTITLRYQPKITIITPVFGIGGGGIKETLESIERQYYRNWELYLLVDERPQLKLSKLIREIFKDNQEIKIKINVNLDHNLAHILNEVLNECNGECIGFLSGSDELTKDALFEVVNLLNLYPDADIIYSDEAKKDQEALVNFFYKPNWSPDLFLSMNYLGNFLCIRTEMIRNVGGFLGKFEDDIRYDLVLRIIEKTEKIHHIPNILYHERVPKNSYPEGFTADYSFELHKKALEEHIKRIGIQGEICDGIFKGSFRVHRRILGQPKVSIIIPTKDKADELKRCVESIESKTTYREFEIIIVDNASTEFELLQYLKSSRYKVIQYTGKFNFSKINNLAAQHSKGEYFLFLNNDTQVISPWWLEAMLEHAQREEVGVVGAKLLYPDGLIQHAGVVLERNSIRHLHRFNGLFEHGYYGTADVIRNFNAVTGACLMVRKKVFKEVGGFEENLSTIYNDVDLCLRVRSRGYLVVYTPYALLYHHEGMSRWSDNRKKVESVNFFCSRWNEFVEDDIYWNPNFYFNRLGVF